MQANASFSFLGVFLLARTYSYALCGLEPVRVDVEVDAATGLPGLTIVGLPDQAVREARERVRSALINSQFRVPNNRLTVNLAPADLKKEGGAFDLPIALGILAASGQVAPEALNRLISTGELALDGTLRPVPGVLPIARALRDTRMTLLVPAGNAREAGAVEGVRAIVVASLADAVAWLRGQLPLAPLAFNASDWMRNEAAEGDFADVKGQAFAKRALEIAAVGAHHVLLVGPPGSGKSMLAARLASILPPLSAEEALESATIRSVAGLLQQARSLDLRRPYRAPHHTCSAIALVGGGPVPRPGEASLAHHGVLFLDELPEFHRDVLETLRQPLEEGVISIARARRAMAFPARFMLIAAMNPCLCGRLLDSRGGCRCSAAQVQRYLSKVSGPLLDRIDLHVEVPAQPFQTLAQARSGDSSSTIRTRVQRAIAWRAQRNQSEPNARLSARDLKTFCPLTPEAMSLLKTAMQELDLSARSYAKILKIARTVADLTEQPTIQPDHIAEAIQYRSLDRRLWA